MNGQRGYSPWSYGRYMPQGQGAYNPYMKYPDWGQVIRAIIQGIQAPQRWKQQRQQQEQIQQQQQQQQELRALQMQQIKRQQDEALRRRGGMRWLGGKFPQVEPWTAIGETPPKEIMAGIAGIQQPIKLTARDYREKAANYMVQTKQWTPEQGMLFTETGAPPKPAPETQEERESRIKREAEIRASITAKYRREPIIKPEPTPEEIRQKGATIRTALQKRMGAFYKSLGDMVEKGRIKAKELKKIIQKQGGGRPVSQQGYALDMPEKYNRAVLNQRNGVALPEDIDIIEKYDAMFKRFQDTYLPDFPTFNDWMRSEYPRKKSIDSNQIRIWYEIYGIK